MHYSTQVKEHNNQNLVVTGRKKSLKHKFIYVQSGLILCRLGKIEYTIEAQQAFWLPFDCLCAWTIFPGTNYYAIDISARVLTSLPKESGHINADDWLRMLVRKTAHTPQNSELYPHLSYVLLDALSHLKPALKKTPLSTQISAWSVSAPVKDEQINDLLTAREIRKLAQSGRKEDAIIKALFDNNKDEYSRICDLYLG
jgi:hypothetical protein